MPDWGTEGVLALRTLPLRRSWRVNEALPGPRGSGVLNVYARTPNAFRGLDRQLMALLARVVATELVETISRGEPGIEP